MSLRRRTLIRRAAIAGGALALTGCDGMLGRATDLLDPLPEQVALPAGETIDPVFHLLSRAAYGPRPGDIERVRRLGATAWIDRQLDPDSIDDLACELRLGECELAGQPGPELVSVEPRFVRRDLVRASLIRAVHSHRQLFEVMVGFWTDHFSIDLGKRGCDATKPWDDRTVIRAHALGRFRELLRASALSPAMLIYLDGRENKRRTPEERPNENYARELLELHTLGVHGGYTQTDVMEVARCLSGWTLGTGLFDKDQPVFKPEWHDDGEKQVLGHTIPAGGGEKDLDDVLDIVSRHPSTARHLATKLCRRLVSDPAPESLVESTAAVFTKTDGSMRDVVRHVLTSVEFQESRGAKVKRPFRYIASVFRTLGAECRAGKKELRYLERMGHSPFDYPTPDGYPEEAEPWMGSLLWRWNFALETATGRLDRSRVEPATVARRCGLDPKTASVADLAPLLYGRAATTDERAAVDAYAPAGAAPERRGEGLALLLAGPAFQVT